MLTEKQKLTLDFIKIYTGKHGAAPTYQEIAVAFEVTSTAAFQRVQTLEQKGYVTRSRMHRRIVLTQKGGDRMAKQKQKRKRPPRPGY